MKIEKLPEKVIVNTTYGLLKGTVYHQYGDDPYAITINKLIDEVERLSQNSRVQPVNETLIKRRVSKRKTLGKRTASRRG